MLDTASNLYNSLLKIYSDLFDKHQPYKKKEIALKNRPKNFSLEEYSNYEGWFSENEIKNQMIKKEGTANLPSMSPH